MVRLMGVQGPNTGVANVYDSSNVHEHIELWEAMFEALPRNRKWVMEGDWEIGTWWNHIKHRSKGLKKFQVKDRKYHGCKSKTLLYLRIFSYTNFSWDNFHVDGTRILGRLDRFYVSTNPNESSLVLTCTIKV